jgi:KaiC/GvpD/RAD55 family RecA-like ATPase
MDRISAETIRKMNHTERYLELLTGHIHGPTMWAWRIDQPNGGGMSVKVGDLPSMSGMLADKQANGYGIFNLVNRSRLPDRRQAADIASIRAIWMDLDGFADMPKMPLDPTMVVKTKHGYHVYYVLDTPSHDIEWGVGMNRTLCQKYGGDANAADACRVLRVPGFLHLKDPANPFMVELIEDCGKLYSTAHLEDSLGRPLAAPTGRSMEQGGIPMAIDAEDTPWGRSAARREMEAISAAPVGGRNAQIVRSAFKLGQIVGGGELTMESAVNSAMSGARECGYVGEEGEIATLSVINSSIRAGVGKPRVSDAASKDAKAVHAGDVCQQRDGLLGRLTEAIDRRIKMGFNPAPGPLRMLNEKLGGGAPAGAVTLLGAPPGMGKSSLALDWAYGHASSGLPALYCSLELSELDLYARLTTLRSGLSWIDVRCGRYRDELLQTVQESLHRPFYSTTRHELQSQAMLTTFIDTISQKYGQPPLVIIDYLQLMIPAGETREQWAVMADISGEVAQCAQDSGSPILCITAVNRQSYNITDKATGKPDQMMALAAAKQSGRLEYDAEAILGLQLFEANDRGEQYGWVIVAKNRSGGSSGSLGIRYDGRSGKFFDADYAEVFESIDIEKQRRHSNKESDVEDRLTSALNSKRFRSKDELFKFAKVSRATGSTALVNLIDKRRVIKNMLGEYMAVKEETNEEEN